MTARLTITRLDGTEVSYTIAELCSAAYLAELLGEVAPAPSATATQKPQDADVELLEPRPLQRTPYPYLNVGM